MLWFEKSLNPTPLRKRESHRKEDFCLPAATKIAYCREGVVVESCVAVGRLAQHPSRFDWWKLLQLRRECGDVVVPLETG